MQLARRGGRYSWVCAAAVVGAGALPITTFGQTAPAPAGRELSLEPIVVTAQKTPEQLQRVAESITVVGARTIEEADIRTVRDAAFYVPNLTLQEFTNPRLSFPFVRGVGSGRNSPAVTTYIDGVPQLSFATSNQEMYDARQVEFIRGPQGTLYGRNTLGGVVNITNNQPGDDVELFGRTTVGNYYYNDTYAGANLPLVKNVLSLRLAGGYMSRDGYTKNTVTGHDLDSREAEFGRMALKFTPLENLIVTLRFNGEHDADGDYALGDLAAIRRTPHRVARDFEGSSTRDLGTGSLTVEYGLTPELKLTSITAYTGWSSRDLTDLDTSPLNLVNRRNRERQDEFTQEFRLASAPLVLADKVKLSFVAGVFLFAEDYRARAENAFSAMGAGFLSPPVPIAFSSFESGDLSNSGVGVFGQSTLSVDKLDLTLGARGDYEHRGATLGSSTNIPFAPATSTTDSGDFVNGSFRAALAYHLTPDWMVYGSAAQGYKAGGFNVTSPAGKTAFGEESSWTYEVGKKLTLFDRKLTVNADLFYIDWRDMQLDVPAGSPGQFYIDNVGSAYSYGAEVEATYRPVKGLEVFTGLGLDRAKFERYSPSAGVSYAGHELPYAPTVTWNVGAQYTMKLEEKGDLRAWVRGEALTVGQFAYDASGAQSQDMYNLANFRVGVGGTHWKVEGWVKNAMDTNYVPLAFPLGFAPSGYVGESGAPRTFGVTVSLEF